VQIKEIAFEGKVLAYWLMKSEPNAWSWEDPVKDGVAEWDSVHNYQAADNMNAKEKATKSFLSLGE
jgi:predicted RNA-binding protein with PUA-like domain